MKPRFNLNDLVEIVDPNHTFHMRHGLVDSWQATSDGRKVTERYVVRFLNGETTEVPPESIEARADGSWAESLKMRSIQHIPIYLDLGIISAEPKCDHNFVDYFGLRESFRYCTKCDAREQ